MRIDETKLNERERAILALLRKMYAFYNDGHYDNDPCMYALYEMIISGFDIFADEKEK